MVWLALPLEVPERGAAFWWIGARAKSMLGPWEIASSPLSLGLHLLAFSVCLDHVLGAPERLRAQGVTPLSFAEGETAEPRVLAWMPAAAVYFCDPHGYLVEYLAMLADEPAGAGIIPYSEWVARF